MADRPLINSSINDIELYVDDLWSDERSLAFLAGELAYRRSKRAKNLLAAVRERLNVLASQRQKAKKSAEILVEVANLLEGKHKAQIAGLLRQHQAETEALQRDIAQSASMLRRAESLAARHTAAGDGDLVVLENAKSGELYYVTFGQPGGVMADFVGYLLSAGKGRIFPRDHFESGEALDGKLEVGDTIVLGDRATYRVQELIRNFRAEPKVDREDDFPAARGPLIFDSDDASPLPRHSSPTEGVSLKNRLSEFFARLPRQ